MVRADYRGRRQIDTYREILRRLDDEEGRGPLPPLLELYRRWANLLLGARAAYRVWPGTQPLVPDWDPSGGRPLLRLTDLDVDWPLYTRTYSAVCKDLLSEAGAAGELVDSITTAAADPDMLRQAAVEFYNRPQAWREVASAKDVGLRTATHLALQPFLAAAAEAAAGRIAESGWHRGNCPFCGGSPDLSYLDRDRGSRWLMCSRCDTVWPFSRLQCPYCDNQKQDSLSYLIDDTGAYRLYMCLECRSYLKAVDLRRAGAQVLLPLERVMTADLDRQGAELLGTAPPASGLLPPPPQH